MTERAGVPDGPRPAPRDAAASKQALLDAARALFSQRGFDGTTTREIGERAQLDAALIARYFGSKAHLYIAALAADNADDPLPEELEDVASMVDFVLSRIDDRGPGPVLQALVRSGTSAEIRDAARAHVSRRLVDPLRARAGGGAADGGDGSAAAGTGSHSRLRAEIAVAALLGVGMARSLGWFDTLDTASRDEVVAIVRQGLDHILRLGS